MTKEEIEQTRGCNAELIHNSVRFFRSFVFCERDLARDCGSGLRSSDLAWRSADKISSTHFY